MRLPIRLAYLGVIWSLLSALWLTQGAVVINEIHHSPVPRQKPLEFIELFNSGTNAVDLSGWQLTSGVRFLFPTPSTIPAGGYLVIAENPAAIATAYGVASALGPWTGGLGGTADTVTLRDAAGTTMDKVDYQNGFPWPTVGSSVDQSIELVTPVADRALGSNWRPSGSTTTAAPDKTLVQAGEVWRYRKGTSEASTPTTAWRASGFDDSEWSTGGLPIGYDPSVSIATRLDDMRNNYRQVFLRKHITVTNADQFSELHLSALFDDGFKLWINGQPLLSVNLPEGEVPYDATSLNGAREDGSYAPFVIPLPAGALYNGDNVLAVQLANVDLSNSSDAFFDAVVIAASAGAGSGPSPGRINGAFTSNPPPSLRQVQATPKQPTPGTAVTLSVRATDPDGVTSVTAEYQLVEPGKYIELTDLEYTTRWTPLPMSRTAEDTNVFRVTLPADLSHHRNLIRYRFVARDALGAETRAPYADDPVPNFAVFCYGSIPEWRGAIHPGTAGSNGAPFTVSAEEMNRLPAFHLITKNPSVLASTGWAPGKPNNHYTGDNYLWKGALVFDGEVYDHVRYRARGGVWRYSMGKNAWKLDFNPGHDLKMRDNFGRSFSATWDKLSFRPDIQQGDYDHRGEQGLFESVGYRLFQLAGVAANNAVHIQLRVIDEVEEAPASSQFDGDFWGVYLAVEEQDGQFLKQRGLPDGNIYDMEGGSGSLNHAGKEGSLDKSDLNLFLQTYNSPNAPPESWWRTNLNLPSYYGYQTVVQGLHHYDIADGKNYFYYRNPVDNRWVVQPWDLDLSWADNMYRAGFNGGDEPFKSKVLANFSAAAPRYPALSREFRNRVRELRDLLFNPDQGSLVIDEQARLIRGTNSASIVAADRCQWDYNPIMTNTAITLSSKAGWGRFYQFPQEPGVGHSFSGAVQLMKKYINYRTGLLDTLSTEPSTPETPRLSYLGPAGYPANQITLSVGAYAGSTNRASTKWRVAEISRPDHPSFRPGEPMKFEVEPTWETPELATPGTELTIPANTLRPGLLYRARVRFTDVVGRASNWSAPVEFTAGEPDAAANQVSFLKISEVMYHPIDSGSEYIELFNGSPTTALDLGGVKFTAGIGFVFPDGATLPPLSFALVVKSADVAAFRAFYHVPVDTVVFGPFTGSLNNAGETVTLKAGSGAAVIASFAYSPLPPWPSTGDTGGYSLVPREGSPEDPADPAHWRARASSGGSAGTMDPAPAAFFLSVPKLSGESLQVHVDTASTQAFTLQSSTNAIDWIPVISHTGPLDHTLPMLPGGQVLFLRALRP